MNFSEGDIINGKYRIIELIGGGAMGKVYKAENINMHKPVALKILHGDVASNDEYQKRFMREARSAAALEHSNICTVMDFDTTETGLPYIVMELLTGETLSERIRSQGSLNPLESVRIMRQLMGALSCAHEGGVVHRDVKPDNIFLIQREGRSDFVKLIDFGIAHIDNPDGDLKTLTQAGTLYGTPQYISPEQAETGIVDFHADLYAAGIIFYEMLMGTPPFSGKNYIELLMHHVNDPPPHISEKLCQGSRIDAIIQRLLKKDPNERYGSALEVIPLLDEILVLMSAESSNDSELHAAIASRSMNLDVQGLQNMADGSSEDSFKSFISEKRLAVVIAGIIVFLILILAIVIVVKWGGNSEEENKEIASVTNVIEPEAEPTVKNESVIREEKPADDSSPTEENVDSEKAGVPEFDIEATEFKISVDDVLRQDPKMLEAYEFYAAKKYRKALDSMNEVKEKYWSHPNFLRLYIQLCRKIKNSYKLTIEAMAQIMSIEPNAVRNSVIRSVALEYFDRHREEFESALLAKKSDIIFQSCAFLIIYLEYQNGAEEKIKAIRETMNEVPVKKIPAWMHEALSFHEFPQDDCDSRLKTVKLVWEHYPKDRDIIFKYVIVPLSKQPTNSCRKDGRKFDCYVCMRDWLAETIEAHKQEVLPK